MAQWSGVKELIFCAPTSIHATCLRWAYMKLCSKHGSPLALSTRAAAPRCDNLDCPGRGFHLDCIQSEELSVRSKVFDLSREKLMRW